MRIKFCAVTADPTTYPLDRVPTACADSSNVLVFFSSIRSFSVLFEPPIDVMELLPLFTPNTISTVFRLVKLLKSATATMLSLVKVSATSLLALTVTVPTMPLSSSTSNTCPASVTTWVFRKVTGIL